MRVEAVQRVVFGIHAIFGGFIAGVVLPREKVVQRDLEQKLEPVVLTLLVPVFFVVVGLGTQINHLDSVYLWIVTLVVTLVAVVGKLGGAMLAARVVGETWRDASVTRCSPSSASATPSSPSSVAPQPPPTPPEQHTYGSRDDG